MALIKCNNCGKEISDKSKKCIHCNNLVKSICCPSCNEKIDLDKNRCPKCNKILRNKVSVLGKIWIMSNAVGLSFLALLFLMNMFYGSTLINLFIGLSFIVGCVMNCLLFARVNPIYFHISNAINYLSFILFLADRYCEKVIAIILLIYAISYSIITYLFIKKCIRHKKISLIYIISIGLLFISYMTIAYLNPIKYINFSEKYKEYLDYALGDYTIEQTNYKSLKNFWFYEDSSWTITYKDINNTTKEIHIFNYELEDYDNKEEASDYIFARSILEDYIIELNNKLQTGNISNLDKYIYIRSLYTLYEENEYDYTYLYHPEILKFINPESGLNFKDIKINTLDNNLYYLELGVLYIPPASSIEAYTKNQVNKIINNYNIKNAFVSCGIKYNDNSNAYPTYCLKDGNEINCPTSYEYGDEVKLLSHKENYISLK